MAAPYSQDLRDKVLAACDRGMTTKEVADAFGVCRAWVRRVKQRRREHGETRPRKQGTPGVRRIDRDVLAKLVAERPEATGPELRDRLAERTGVRVTDSAIYAALKALDLTFKKRRSTRPSRIAPMSPSVASSGNASSPNATHDV